MYLYLLFIICIMASRSLDIYLKVLVKPRYGLIECPFLRKPNVRFRNISTYSEAMLHTTKQAYLVRFASLRKNPF